MKISGSFLLYASWVVVTVLAKADNTESLENDAAGLAIEEIPKQLDKSSSASIGDVDEFDSSNVTISASAIDDIPIAAGINSSASETDHNVEPLHYTIRFAPNVKDKSFITKMNLDFKVRRNSNQVTLHAVGLNLTKTLITESGNDSALNTNRSFLNTEEDTDSTQKPTQIIPNELNQTITLVFDLELKPDKQFRLIIEAEGKIPNRVARGLIYSDSSMKTEGSYMLFTSFEEIGARRVFPCIDEPSTRASFNWEIEHDEDQDITVISNTDVQSKEKSTNKGKSISKFSKTPPISTYHNAFAVLKGAEKVTITESGRVKVEGYFNLRELENQNDARYFKPSVEIAAKAMKYYEEKLGINYPFETFRVLYVPELPHGTLGFENFGLATLLAETAVIDEQKPCLGNCNEYVIMLHEAAHQWLGGIVTVQTWNQTWIKEGLTQWMTFTGLKDLYPKIFKNTATYGEPAYALMIDTLRDTPPLELLPSHNMDSAFESIWRNSVYMKSVYVFSALSKIISKDKFFESLSRLVKNRSFKAAGYEDVVNAFQTPRSKDFLNAWVKNSGHPTMFLQRSKKDQSTFFLKQKPDITLPPAAKGYKVNYPTYIKLILGNEGLQQRVRFKPVPQTNIKKFNLAAAKNVSYILFNTSENHAFYQPLYSKSHLEGLAEQGVKKVMHAEHRLYLLRQLEYSHGSCARLLEAWKAEDDARVFRLMMIRVRNLATEYSRYMPDLAPAFKKFQAHLMTANLKKVKNLNSTGWSAVEQLSNSDVEIIQYGCAFNLTETFELCSSLYRDYDSTAKNAKTTKLRTHLFIHAMSYSKERGEAIKSLKKKMLDPTVEEGERHAIAQAMGMISDKKEVHNILDDIVANQEKLNEAEDWYPTYEVALQGMARATDSSILWEWVKDRWDEIKTKEQLIYSAPAAPVQGFAFLSQIEEYCSFFKERKSELPADAIDEINRALVTRYYKLSKIRRGRKDLLSFLREKGFLDPKTPIQPAMKYPRDGPLLQKLCFI